MFQDTALKLISLKAKKISQKDFEKFLRQRDNNQLLDMGSASFNYF